MGPKLQGRNERSSTGPGSGDSLLSCHQEANADTQAVQGLELSQEGRGLGWLSRSLVSLQEVGEPSPRPHPEKATPPRV